MKKIYILLSAVLLASACQQGTTDPINVIPYPDEVEVKGGTFNAAGAAFSYAPEFDQAAKEGVLDKVFTTNLVYRRPELAEKKWYVELNMCKYVAYIIDTLNHDRTISHLLDQSKKIHTILDAHKNK